MSGNHGVGVFRPELTGLMRTRRPVRYLWPTRSCGDATLSSHASNGDRTSAQLLHRVLRQVVPLRRGNADPKGLHRALRGNLRGLDLL
jgi:hypothetical protein